MYQYDKLYIINFSILFCWSSTVGGFIVFFFHKDQGCELNYNCSQELCQFELKQFGFKLFPLLLECYCVIKRSLEAFFQGSFYWSKKWDSIERTKLQPNFKKRWIKIFWFFFIRIEKKKVKKNILIFFINLLPFLALFFFKV